MIRINADDDTMTLGDMLRHERSGAGMQDQRNLDAELARAITTDGKFQVCFRSDAWFGNGAENVLKPGL